ncbi:class I SAM-dependent methyltransferase [Xylophilus sp. GOD-11R]|uniref:class I SAM-dependent methyltransferase n=1 Tax=Xylophilus sp. GOD-11R TaxID=3089814 RepID=UPI00298BD4AF|nr:class I SAM-dependent methyltransferase [Xylophilus sp. GOD-11R]WPB57087.1 class I SAM-dependent methyltransferase [Xylophilus sp. GOD-11R]
MRTGLSAAAHVPETRFGKWFLKSETWSVHVLDRAMADLCRLIPARRERYPVVVDVGCGSGRSLPKLAQCFGPTRLVGVDIDPDMLAVSSEWAMRHGVQAELLQGSSSQLSLADASADLLFCHQTFHHLVEQEAALAEFWRVLKPGGILLFAESTRRYIESLPIRLLFRHPMEVQRTAAEYLQMIRSAGFQVPSCAVSYPYLWWSRPDLGIAEKAFGWKPARNREETLLNLVAVKPGS